MKKFAGYEEARTNEFENRERLQLGPHRCKIIEAKVVQLKTQDGKIFDQLQLKIDIAEPDEQAGFFNRKFQEDAKVDALKAKWKGYYTLTVPEDNSEQFIKDNFKTLITSVEKSNPGYKWNWEENTLVGKELCGVFGLEEFVNLEGNTISFTRCRFVRSTENMDKIPIPKVRLADKSLIDYEEYIEKKKAEREGNNNQTTIAQNSDFSKIGDDNLPF